MGFNFGWVAVRGRESSVVLKTLGLRATGERAEIREGNPVGCALPGGWYLVEMARWEVVEDDVAAELSQGGEAVVARAFEMSMMSYAARFVDGNMAWSVGHDGQNGPENDIEPEGEVCERFQTILDEAVKSQQADDEVDFIFDVPLEYAKHFTGYKHDEGLPGDLGDEPYEILEQQSG